MVTGAPCLAHTAGRERAAIDARDSSPTREDVEAGGDAIVDAVSRVHAGATKNVRSGAAATPNKEPTRGVPALA
jgi:hypothetical protein